MGATRQVAHGRPARWTNCTSDTQPQWWRSPQKRFLSEGESSSICLCKISAIARAGRTTARQAAHLRQPAWIVSARTSAAHVIFSRQQVEHCCNTVCCDTFAVYVLTSQLVSITAVGIALALAVLQRELHVPPTPLHQILEERLCRCAARQPGRRTVAVLQPGGQSTCTHHAEPPPNMRPDAVL